MVEIGIHERVDDLQISNLKLIQDKRLFCFGIDAVLLANFAEIKKNQIGIDLGTGNGIIPILLSGKKPVQKVYGVEIQEKSAALAQRSVLLNHLEEKVEILIMDLKDAPGYFGNATMDFVISNPPYIRRNSLTNPSLEKSIARHEVACTLDDVIKSASKLLNDKGNLFMIHRPNRLSDIICTARDYRLEAKEVRFVQSRIGEPPSLVLVRLRKYGASDLVVKSPWIIYDEEGNYTPEILSLYGKNFEEGVI